MKLLVLAKNSDRSEESIFCALPKHGFEVHVACDEDFANKESVKAAGLKTHLRNFGGRFDFESAKFVRNLVREYNIDVIYAPGNNTLGIGMFASIGARNKLVGYRGTTHHLHWYDPASLVTYLSPRVDRIICVSDAVKNYLLGMGLPERKLRRIYKGHNVHWYSGMKQPSHHDMGIPENAFVISFVGRIRPVKGCEIIIEALKSIPPEKNIILLMVGEMAHPKIQEMLQNETVANRVRYLGYRLDAPAIAGMSKIFLMISHKREGLPRAVIEAMAQGVPPIVTNAGGMPELVQDGKSGIVIETGNAKALADAILRFYSDESFRQECGKNARKRIEEHFNVTKTTEKYAALFAELCKQ